MQQLDSLVNGYRKDQAPARSLNGTAYEEVLFEDHLTAALGSYTAPGGPHSAGAPLFMHYAPHLVHDPYEVPAEWLEKFAFIAAKGDDVKGLRQVGCTVECSAHWTTVLGEGGGGLRCSGEGPISSGAVPL